MKPINEKPRNLLLAILLTAFAVFPATAQEQYVPDTNMLLESVRNSDLHTINTILNNGADVNEQDRTLNTALMTAAKIGDRMIVETLLAHGADPNIRNAAGSTALMIAAKYGHNHVVTQLLKHGADPLIQNNSGIKASRFAAVYKHQTVYRTLIDAEENALKGVASKAKKTS